jgi:uncharacterized protein (TIGR02147 family)
MKSSIYEYRDYKSYLRHALDAREERGVRSRLAEAAQCHTAYISQTLNGNNHFSLEQGERIAHFLGLGSEQTSFLLLLIQYGRAGTPALRKILERQIHASVEAQLVLKNRLEFKKTLSREDQATFYSSWQYGAVHVLVSVPGCHSEQGIADYLGLPLQRVSEILQFLLSVGLVARKGNHYEIGTSHIHLESDSPMISKHHTNWRMRAVQSLDQPRPEELHYSSVITASREDSSKIREILVRAIEEVRAVVRKSGNEEGYCYSLDFFGLKK